MKILLHISFSNSPYIISKSDRDDFYQLLHDLKANSFEIALLFNKSNPKNTLELIETAKHLIAKKDIHVYSNIEGPLISSSKLIKLSHLIKIRIINEINPDDCVHIFLNNNLKHQLFNLMGDNKHDMFYKFPNFKELQTQIKLNQKTNKQKTQYTISIEQKNKDLKQIIKSTLSLSNQQEKILAANCITQNFQSAQVKKQLLFDISEIINQGDLGTGIQRVVRSQLFYLLQNPPSGFAVYPVFLSKHKGYHFRHAYKKLKDLNWSDNLNPAPNLPIDYFPGDILYLPDQNAEDMIMAEHIGLFDLLKLNKVTIFSFIHDLLPYINPEYFPTNSISGFSNWLNIITKISDNMICNSEATQNQLNDYLESQNLQNKQVDNIQLGASTEVKKINTRPLPKTPNANKSVTLFNSPLKTKEINFLMIGTIEPRKGHYQVLSAFDKLWQQGYSVNLIIVGKSGWSTDTKKYSRFNINELIKRINNHSRLNKNLFLYQGISDTELKTCYQNCSCLIIASEAEGFGLPIIEASKHKLPIIARDLAVFKEIAKDSAFYFNNDLTENTIFSAVKDWLTLYKSNQHPKSENIRFMNWQQHTDKLADIFVTYRPSEVTVDLKKIVRNNMQPTKKNNLKHTDQSIAFTAKHWLLLKLAKCLFKMSVNNSKVYFYLIILTIKTLNYFQKNMKKILSNIIKLIKMILPNIIKRFLRLIKPTKKNPSFTFNTNEPSAYSITLMSTNKTLFNQELTYYSSKLYKKIK